MSVEERKLLASLARLDALLATKRGEAEGSAGADDEQQILFSNYDGVNSGRSRRLNADGAFVRAPSIYPQEGKLF